MNSSPLHSIKNLSGMITCVSWFDPLAWDAERLLRVLVPLCNHQPYAPSASNIEGFVKAGAASRPDSSDEAVAVARAGKACLLLETRPNPQTKPTVGAALWSLAGDEAELEYVVVDPTWRRGGWGLALMELSHRYLAQRQVRRCVLEVAVRNLHAILLYQALGYIKEGVRPRYYTDGQDALVLVRTVPAL